MTKLAYNYQGRLKRNQNRTIPKHLMSLNIFTAVTLKHIVYRFAFDNMYMYNKFK